MESSSNLEGYDWFHSMDDSVVYVHYMNNSVFSVVPAGFKIHFSCFKETNLSNYKLDLGTLGSDNEE